MKKILILAIVCTLFLGCSDAGENPVPPSTSFKYGTSPYAIRSDNFPCEEYLASIDILPEIHVSWLEHSFGTRESCLLQALNHPNIKSFQVHLLNEVCVRNDNCGGYEPLAGLSVDNMNDLAMREEGWFLQRVLAAANDTALFLQRWGNPHKAQCYLSLGLESNLEPEAYEKVLSYVKPMFPDCETVYNPVNSSLDLASSDYLEHHETNTALQAPCIYNNDGHSIEYPGIANDYIRTLSEQEILNVFEQKSACKLVFIWHHDYNCIDPDGFIDPRDRECRSESFMNLAETIKKAPLFKEEL